MSVNRCFIQGNLIRDPEQTYTSAGTAVCKFTVATNEKYKDKEVTEFHNVVAWSKLGENCAKYLTKGSPCFVEGKLQTSSWEKDGVKKYRTEIIANNVQFMGTKGGNNPADSFGGMAEKKPVEMKPEVNITSDDIPF